ncbi:MAG: tetratricopeptide repeat protein [Acidobacteriota bacterium]|nr:MAG: tetratricopeptide repeat protein [Acidobacteriota bacterium]
MSETPGRPRGKATLWVVVVIVVVAVAGWWMWRTLPSVSLLTRGEGAEEKKEEQFVIAVAPFWGPDERALEKGLDMQRLAEEMFEQELGDEENVTILADDFIPPRTEEEARVLGETLQADLILWGQIHTFPSYLEIRPHLELLRTIRWLRERESSVLVFFTLPEEMSLEKIGAQDLRNAARLVMAAHYQGEPDKALGFLQKIDPPTAESLRWQGNIYVFQNNWEEAEVLFQQAIALDPEYAVLHVDVGWAHTYQEEYEEALSSFQKAMELDPKDAEAHAGLGWAYSDLGRYEESVQEFLKAVALDPHSFATRNGLGWVYYHMGRYEESVREFQTPIPWGYKGAERRTAAASEYEDSYSQLAYTLALLKTGMEKEARAHEKELRKIYAGLAEAEWPAPLVRFYAGIITEDAALEAAESDDEETDRGQKCEAYYYVGMRRLLGGDREKAGEFFKKCLATGATTFPEYRSTERELGQSEQ